MANADEDRLLALIEAARARLGNDVLQDPARLVPWIADKAPELRPLARAAATALAAGVAGHAALSQAAAAGGATPELADAAARLAMRVTQGIVPGSAPPAETQWVGASVPARAAASPAGTAAPAAWQRYKWPAIAVAALAALYLAGTSGSNAPAPRAAPPPASPPAPPQAAQAAVPLLTAAQNGALPVVPVQKLNDGIALIFDVPAGSAALRGIVAFPNKTWDSVRVAFGQPGADQPGTISSAGAAELHAGQGSTLRVLRPRWTKDDAHAGEICVIFAQKDGADVQMTGAQLCLLEYTANDCRKVIGCGRVG